MLKSLTRKIVLIVSFTMLAAFAALIMAQQDDIYAAAFKPTVTVKANKITVSWDKQSGFSKYEVWFKPFYSRSGFKLKKRLSGLKCSLKGKYCTAYRVYVKAVKGRKNKKSSEVKFETGSNPKLNVERVASLPSKKVNSNYYASRVDAMVFVGDDLYYLKSAHNAIKKEVHKGYYPMAIGCIKNFSQYSDTQNPPVTFKVIKYANGELYYGSHGSSIAYYNGDFYIVTVESHKKGDPIICVGKDGKIKKEIDTKGFYYNHRKFSALSFYGMAQETDPDTGEVINEYPQFICRDGKNTTRVSSKYGYELHRFSIGVLKGNTLERVGSYMTENTREAAFWQRDKKGAKQLHSNDIGYDLESGILYHSIFIYERNKNIKKNWLYSYNLNDSTEVWPYDDDQKTNTLVQKNKKAISLSTKNSSETKFEIEGVDAYNGEAYIAVNTDGVEDGLYKVK